MENDRNSEPASDTPGPILSSSNSKLKKLSDFLECCICRQELQDAHICGQCSQPFCRKCILEWLAKEQSCPHCRHALTERAIVPVRTFAQLGVVVSELLASEQNRCRPHYREQLFYCFPCEQSICDRCMFEKVHLEHRDHVVLLEKAFDHFNKHTSMDYERINKLARTLEKQQDHIQKNKQLLKTEFEGVDAIIRHASETISSQYKQNLSKLEQTQEIVEKQSSAISDILQKPTKFELKEKTATALEQLITFQKKVAWILSQSSSTDKTEGLTMDLSLENDVIPSPVKITFQLNNYKATMKKHKYCESLANGKYGSVWRLKVSQVNSCTMTSLLLEQGKPGAYWAAYYGNPAKLHQFDQRKFVVMSVVNTSPINDYSPEDDAAVVVISIWQARSYAEECQQQQDHIDRLEKKIARYDEFIADIQEKMRAMQLEDENEEAEQE